MKKYLDTLQCWYVDMLRGCFSRSHRWTHHILPSPQKSRMQSQQIRTHTPKKKILERKILTLVWLAVQVNCLHERKSLNMHQPQLWSENPPMSQNVTVTLYSLTQMCKKHLLCTQRIFYSIIDHFNDQIITLHAVTKEEKLFQIMTIEFSKYFVTSHNHDNTSDHDRPLFLS